MDFSSLREEIVVCDADELGVPGSKSQYRMPWRRLLLQGSGVWRDEVIKETLSAFGGVKHIASICG